MKLLTWFSAKRRKKPPVQKLAGCGNFLCEVAGVDQFQANLERVCGGGNLLGNHLEMEAELAELPYDPGNRYPIQVRIKGMPVGHLQNREVKKYIALLQQISGENKTSVSARITYHLESRPNYRARIDLPK